MLLVKSNHTCFPAYESDRKEFAKLKQGEVLNVSTKDVRNILHNRKYFALLKKVHFHLPENISNRLTTVDLLRHEIFILIGHTDVYINQKGEAETKVKSSSFLNVGQKKFEQIYSDSLSVIGKYYLSNWTDEMIEYELINFF